MTERMNRRQEAGLTLLEVLISLLVLSLGLAGLATLYLTSLSSIHSGLFTSLASSIALDFEERLWIEVGRRGDGTCPDYENIAEVLQDRWSGSEGATQFFSLPGLSIDATHAESNPDQRFQEISLTIQWDEGRFGENADREQFAYTTRIYCRP